MQFSSHEFKISLNKIKKINPIHVTRSPKVNMREKKKTVVEVVTINHWLDMCLLNVG